MAEDLPNEDELLTALDRQNRQRLADQLRRPAPPPGEEVFAGALAGVLFDVLVEGSKPESEAGKQLGETWDRIGGDDKIITRRTFDFEALMVGAFGTIVAIDLALDGDEKDRVLAAFEKEPTSLAYRFRRGVPNPGRFKWYMDFYDEALGPEHHPDRTWYVPIARAFVTACREQAGDPEAFAEAEPQIAAAGLEVFLRAASGTIEALRGWTIV